jgi:hypothetical protein
MTMMPITKQRRQSDVNNDNNDGNGRDCNGNGDGNGDGGMIPLLMPTATMSMMTMAVIWGQQLDNGNQTMAIGWRQCDGDGQPASFRVLASTAPCIQGNNQLLWTVWGGGDKREGRFGRKEPISTQPISNHLFAHPRAEKALEAIFHASWE